MQITHAVIKNGMLRYNATCEICGESFIFTDGVGNLIMSRKQYDCTACGAKETVFIHKLTELKVCV